MSQASSNLKSPDAELARLIDSLCDGTVTHAERNRLQDLLDADPANLRFYVEYLDLHAQLQWEHRGLPVPTGPLLETCEAPESDELEPTAAVADEKRDNGLLHDVVDFFSSTSVTSLLAALAAGLLLMVGMALVRYNLPGTGAPPTVAALHSTIDVQWDDQAGEEMATKKSLAVGDRIDLASGLVQVKFESGARVIVEGPASFELEAPNTGMLHHGRLTALVPPQAVGFTVNTPALKIVDLGTEFGTVVDGSGSTQLWVYQGKVEAKPLRGKSATRQLVRGESVAWNPVSGWKQDLGPTRLVRRMPKSEGVHSVLLADIVAGGDGLGTLHHGGIELSEGRLVREPIVAWHQPTDQYLPVHNDVIDGVFIPSKGPIRLSTAGHTTDQIPATSARTPRYVWAGNDLPDGELLSLRMRGTDYGDADHTLVSLPAGGGVTFDLEAVRHKQPHQTIDSLTALGSARTVNSREALELWVYVDGKLRLHKTELRPADGTFDLNLPLTDDDRYLTLVVTSSGRPQLNWILLGDPRLNLSPRH